MNLSILLHELQVLHQNCNRSESSQKEKITDVSKWRYLNIQTLWRRQKCDGGKGRKGERERANVSIWLMYALKISTDGLIFSGIWCDENSKQQGEYEHPSHFDMHLSFSP